MAAKNPFKVKTKRLILTLMSDEEIEKLIEETEDAELKDAYTDMLECSKAHSDARQFAAPWRMSLKEHPEEMIGDIGFKGPQKAGRLEIGYGIHPEYEKQGYTTEAVKALTDWAFSQQDVYIVEAEADPDNTASLRVLDKAGFTANGEMGAEGPRFHIKASRTAWMAIYMCFGVSIGTALGTSNGKLGMYMPLGIAIGMLIGLAIDRSEIKKRISLTGESEKEIK